MKNDKNAITNFFMIELILRLNNLESGCGHKTILLEKY